MVHALTGSDVTTLSFTPGSRGSTVSNRNVSVTESEERLANTTIEKLRLIGGGESVPSSKGPN